MNLLLLQNVLIIQMLCDTGLKCISQIHNRILIYYFGTIKVSLSGPM